jgi:alpha-ketoglutaric semialdehyde dehydrogenase
MPAGVFSLLNGESHELGATLVRHPRVKAVGFTGSRAGGLALMKLAKERPEPIPVYAEMSSINPVVLLPGALAADPETLAKRFVESLTLGSGQFCTNPGLLIALNSPALDRFVAATAAAVEQVGSSAMLTAAIEATYVARVDRLRRLPCVSEIGRGSDAPGLRGARAAFLAVDAATALRHSEISEEVFGPSSVLVRCASEAELLSVVRHLEGQLTATLHFTQEDTSLARSLLSVLEGRVGRLIANGWPTGVEVSHAMVHGGPFPASSDGRSTSVGTLAIERFLRPVCYQDFPDSLLPQPLQNGVFASRPHRYDGEYRTGK